MASVHHFRYVTAIANAARGARPGCGSGPLACLANRATTVSDPRSCDSSGRQVSPRPIGQLRGSRQRGIAMSSIEPERWVERASAAVSFYEKAFGATTLHRVGDGDDIVAQLAVGEAHFWVASADPTIGRFSPEAISGRTSRTLLIVDDPGAVVRRAVTEGATETLLSVRSTAGDSVGSSTPTVTSGRSAHPSEAPVRPTSASGRPAQRNAPTAHTAVRPGPSLRPRARAAVASASSTAKGEAPVR